MNPETSLCNCGMCGYQWQPPHSGQHICTDHLWSQIWEFQSREAVLKEALQAFVNADLQAVANVKAALGLDYKPDTRHTENHTLAERALAGEPPFLMTVIKHELIVSELVEALRVVDAAHHYTKQSPEHPVAKALATHGEVGKGLL